MYPDLIILTARVVLVDVRLSEAAISLLKVSNFQRNEGRSISTISSPTATNFLAKDSRMME